MKKLIELIAAQNVTAQLESLESDMDRVRSDINKALVRLDKDTNYFTMPEIDETDADFYSDIHDCMENSCEVDRLVTMVQDAIDDLESLVEEFKTCKDTLEESQEEIDDICDEYKEIEKAPSLNTYLIAENLLPTIKAQLISSVSKSLDDLSWLAGFDIKIEQHYRLAPTCLARLVINDVSSGTEELLRVDIGDVLDEDGLSPLFILVSPTLNRYTKIGIDGEELPTDKGYGTGWTLGEQDKFFILLDAIGEGIADYLKANQL